MKKRVGKEAGFLGSAYPVSVAATAAWNSLYSFLLLTKALSFRWEYVPKNLGSENQRAT